ncbi:MAG: HAMP domain-containing protein [Planctomycetota bacterium]
MAKGPSRRRILVVEPKLQFRYLILPLVVTVTTGVCLLVFFYLQAEALRAAAGAEGPLQEDIRTTQLVGALTVGAVVLGHIALVVWLGLVASHKIAGPVYRVKQTMNEVASGNETVRITLRKGDHLKDVARAFNAMMDRLAEDRPPGSGDPGEQMDESLDLPDESELDEGRDEPA